MQSFRLIAAALMLLAAAGCSSLTLFDSLTQTGGPDRPAPRLEGRVYVFRGLTGMIFSTGMDDLSNELNARGVRASVHSDTEWRALVDDAINEYGASPKRVPIMLIGHSSGADSLIAMSKRLGEASVPVALAVTFDPTRFVGRVPPNVERFLNIYSSYNLLGGSSTHYDDGFRGHFANVNLREHYEIVHVTIDKTRVLHEAVISKVLQVATFGTPATPDTVPIDYVVPANAQIELWDDGMTIRVAQGDTVQSLAARYGLPAWGITRVNKLDDRTSALEAGRELVIPRYLSGVPQPAPAARSALAR